jgi:CBS domain-containing protein
MERNPITVEADMPIHDVQRLMDEQDRWAVPVVEAGMYRGIFTGDRFLHIYRQLSPDPARSLRELFDRGPLARLRA